MKMRNMDIVKPIMIMGFSEISGPIFRRIYSLLTLIIIPVV